MAAGKGASMSLPAAGYIYFKINGSSRRRQELRNPAIARRGVVQLENGP